MTNLTLKKRLYWQQYYELEERLQFTYSEEDLEAVGADTSEWTDEEWNKWAVGEITDEMIEKSFAHYSFSCDDFGYTARQYSRFKHTDDGTVHRWK